MSDDFGTTLRVLMDSIAFLLLLILGGYMFSYNPIFGFLILFSALDQFEDVYFYTAKRRLFPAWFVPVDIVLEGILAVVGVSMFLFGLIYWYSFDSVFFAIWTVVSLMIAITSVEDIVDDVRLISAKLSRAETPASVTTISVATTINTKKFKFFERLE